MASRRRGPGSDFRYQRDGEPQADNTCSATSLFFNDQNGNLTESCSLSGTMTFDGAGKYTLSNTQTVRFGRIATAWAPALRWAAERTECNPTASPNWTILSTRRRFSAPSANPWSSPVPPKMMASISSSRFKRRRLRLRTASSRATFTVGTLDFLNSSASLARQGYFTLKADGQGNIAAFAVTGSLAKCAIRRDRNAERCGLHLCTLRRGGWNRDFSRQLRRMKPRSSAAQKILYVSADGNWFVGGSATGSDMFVRVSRTLRDQFEFALERDLLYGGNGRLSCLAR